MPQEAIMATPGKTGLFAFDPARCDALSEVLAERWWAVGLRGILAIIFGLICLLTPGIAVGAFVIVFAAYMFVDGVLSRSFPAYAPPGWRALGPAYS